MKWRAPWQVRLWAWLKTYWYIPVLGIVLIIGILFFVSDGGSKAARELLRVDKEMRRRKEKVDKEIEELEEKTEQQIQEVERAHAEALAQVRERQATEYEKVRAKGPLAVARWLNDFDARLRDQ